MLILIGISDFLSCDFLSYVVTAFQAPVNIVSVCMTNNKGSTTYETQSQVGDIWKGQSVSQ